MTTTMMKMKRTSFYLVTDRQHCLQKIKPQNSLEKMMRRLIVQMLMKDSGARHSPGRLHTTQVNTAQEVLSGLQSNFEYLLDVLLHDEERDGAYSMVKRAFCEGYSGCIRGIYTYSCNDKDRKGTVKKIKTALSAFSLTNCCALILQNCLLKSRCSQS